MRCATSRPELNPALVSLSFLLVLIGYGTKVGLAPMHTWLPDAHSEGPAPVSALLSGALLNTAMVGIVRYLVVADAAGISTLARGTVLSLGAFSAVRRGAVHRPPDGSEAADGLFERRAHGRHRNWVRLWRIARNCWRALPHAQSFAEQVADVFRRRQSSCGPTGPSASEASVICRPMFSDGGRVVARRRRRHNGAPPFGLFLSELTIIRAGLSAIDIGSLSPHRCSVDRHLRRFSQSLPHACILRVHGKAEKMGRAQ